MTLSFKVKDLSLAKRGELNIEWARNHMPVLMRIKEFFEKEKPLKGYRIAACLHVTKETAVLMEVLKAGGAEIALAGSNPLSTQDDVAAALVKKDIHVYAWRGETSEEYYWCLRKILEIEPHIIMDDGADLHTLVHKEYQDLVKKVFGGTEETTTGVIRLKALSKAGKLLYPVIAVNNAKTKTIFDNKYLNFGNNLLS